MHQEAPESAPVLHPSRRRQTNSERPALAALGVQYLPKLDKASQSEQGPFPSYQHLVGLLQSCPAADQAEQHRGGISESG